MPMDKILPAFEESLLDPTLRDACLDITELGIDSILDDGVLKAFPLVKFFIGVGKTAQNIHDRNLLKQTYKSNITFKEKPISPKKIEKYRKHLNSNPKFAEEELGRVLVLLNSYVDSKKSELLAKFFYSYVNEEIDWSTFHELSDITSRLFISDLDLLFKFYENKDLGTSQVKSYQADRLIALGLLDFTMKPTLGTISQRHFRINNLGKSFCRIALQ